MATFLRNLCLGAMAGISLGTLGGCVTSQSSDIDPKMATLAKNVLADSCALTSTKGSNSKSNDFKLDEIYISHIEEIRQGVYQASTYFRGFGSNITFDINKARAGCGANSTKLYPSRYLTTYLAKLGKTPETKPSEKRSIAISWEGYTDLFSGTIEELQNGASGNVKITLPNNDGKCSGQYKATSRTKGNWSISCTNKLRASGTYTAFGDGKGASGVGKDVKGRTVTYTLGGRI